VQLLKSHLAQVSHHIDRVRAAPPTGSQQVHRELETAWHTFLDAFAEASRQTR
jgi:hypothetical protein